MMAFLPTQPRQSSPERSSFRAGIPASALAVGIAAVLGVAAVFREAPWEDEIFSLRVFESFHGYRLIPVSFAWLLAGGAVSGDFPFLRLWCFLPYLAGLILARRLLLRLGATPRDAAISMICLAANPYLANECKSVRYYGCLFLAAMAAMLAAVHLVRDRPSGGCRCGALGLVFLPQLVIYSGAGLIAMLLGWWAWRARFGRGSWRALLLPAAGAAAVALLVAWPLRWHLRSLWHAGLSGLGQELPLVLGFAKAPPGLEAVAHQYAQLLGVSPLGWWVPSGIVETAAVIAAGAALLNLARRGPPGGRGLAVLVALMPVAVVVLAPIANLICVRYYLYAAVPVTWAMVFTVRRAGERLRRSSLRAAPAAAFGCVLAASVATGIVVRSDPPLDRLAEAVGRHRIKELAVDPPASTAFVGCFFRLQRVNGIQVREAGMSSAADSGPEWIYRKDARWTWPNPRKAPPLPPPDPEHYEVVECFESLKRFYFHGDRVVDRLYRRRDAPGGHAVIPGMR